MKTFEELHCWQKSKDLAVVMYAHFSNQEENILKTELCTLSMKIMQTIGVSNMKPIKEAMKSLETAREQCGMLRATLHMTKELDMIDEKMFTEFYNEALDLSKMIAGLMKTVKITEQEKQKTGRAA